MDKRMRMKNAMDGQPVDRVPVSFWFHYQGEQAAGPAHVAAELDFYRQTGVDFLKMMSDGFFNYPCNYPVSRAADWARITPLGSRHPQIRDQVERAKRINDALQGDCCTFYNAFAPFSTIRHAAGDARIMSHLRENPAALMSALDAIAEDTCEMIRLLIGEAGCDGVFIPLQGGEVNRFTPEEYKTLISPSETRLIETANRLSDYNIVHLCAWDGIRNQLPIWRDIPCKTVNWAVNIEGLSLGDGKRYFPQRSVMGGFDNRRGSLLMTGSESEIKAHTRQLVQEAGQTGVILAADCSLPSDIDWQRIRWVVEELQAPTKP